MPGHGAINATIWGRDHNGSSDCGSKICPGCAVTDALGRHGYMALSISPAACQVMSGLLVPQNNLVMDHSDQLFTLWSLWSLICISIHHIHGCLVHCSFETEVSFLAHCNFYTQEFPDMSKFWMSATFPPNPRHENVHKLCLWKAAPRCENENEHGQGAPHMATPTATHGHLDDVEGHHSAGHFHGSHQNQASHGGTPSNFSRQKDKTMPSDLSRPANDKPADRQEMATDIAMLWSCSAVRASFAIASTSAKRDTKKFVWTKAEIVDSATSGKRRMCASTQSHPMFLQELLKEKKTDLEYVYNILSTFHAI